MLDSKTVAKAGELLLIDKGEYSDYCVMGLFRIEKDFIPYEVLQEYLKDNPSNNRDYRFEEDRFLSKLVVEGYIIEVQCDNFYLGGYSNVDGIRYHPYRMEDGE